MRIDCLMGTYGRYSFACEAIACFLQQTVLSQATLLVHNQHQVPLRFDHPRVRVVNEPSPAAPVRVIKQRMLELSAPEAELIHWWDDDDLYLPWHLEDGLKHLGESVAWKPKRSWVWMGDKKFALESNFFEGSWIFRADYIRAAPTHTHPQYIDHPVCMQTIEAGLLGTSDLGGRASYIYRWSHAGHVSAHGGSASLEQQCRNIEASRRNAQDVLASGRLNAADLTTLWDSYLKRTKDQV